jgi:hypothetical protein
VLVWSVFSFKAIFEYAIIASAQVGSPAQREPLYFTPELLGWGATQRLDSRQAATQFESYRRKNHEHPKAIPTIHLASIDALRVKVESALKKNEKASPARRFGLWRPVALRDPSPAALGAPATGSGKEPPRCSMKSRRLR